MQAATPPYATRSQQADPRPVPTPSRADSGWTSASNHPPPGPTRRYQLSQLDTAKTSAGHAENEHHEGHRVAVLEGCRTRRRSTGHKGHKCSAPPRHLQLPEGDDRLKRGRALYRRHRVRCMQGRVAIGAQLRHGYF